MSLLDKLFGAPSVPPPRAEDAPLRALVDEYLADAAIDVFDLVPRKTAAGARLLELSPRESVRALEALLRSDPATYSHETVQDYDWAIVRRREKLLSDLCRRNLPLTVEDATTLFDLHASILHNTWLPRYCSLPKSIARAAQAGAWLPAVRAPLERVRDALAARRYAQYAEGRRALKDVEQLIAQATGDVAADCTVDADVWGDKALAALREMDADLRAG